MERVDLESGYKATELAIHSSRYLPARKLVAGKKVLDIACGEGVGTSLLLSWGAAEVVGVDLSSVAIDKAKAAFADHENARFVCSDALQFLDDTTEDFDIIISVETVEHVPDPEAFLKALGQKRKDDTTIIISCPNDYFYFGRGYSLNPYHMTQFSFYDFRTMSEKHLGEANWYLGAPSHGISVVAANAATVSAVTYQKALTRVRNAVGLVVPAPSEEKKQIKPSTALFYLGIWSSENFSRMYQASFPASALNDPPQIRTVSKDVAMGRTRRVAVVIDQHGWAFENIIENMTPYLNGRYVFDRYYIADFATPAELFHKVFVANRYDNVHFMWREYLFKGLKNHSMMLKLMRKAKLEPAALAEHLAAPVLTTAVYDHLFLREDDIAERQESFGLVDGYGTSSRRLHQIYAEQYHQPPTMLVPDGVDVGKFEPARQAQAARSVTGDQPIQIGWVGNSTWGQANASVDDDPKGFQTILVPAVERLVAEGYPVALALADRNIRHRSREEMITYYGEIDILVCSSTTEGTPNPILEAMASAVPFVSTDVGIVREAAGPLQAEYILNTRTVFGMYTKLKELIEDADKRAALAQENLASVQAWHWRQHTPSWLKLWAAAEAAHHGGGRKYRQAVLTGRLVQWQLEQQLKKLKRSRATGGGAKGPKGASAGRRLTPRRILRGIKSRVIGR